MLLLDVLAHLVSHISEYEDLEHVPSSLLVLEGRQKYSCCDLTSSELNGRVGRSGGSSFNATCSSKVVCFGTVMLNSVLQLWMCM